MDTVDPLRFVSAFLFILALIGLMAYLLKRFGGRFQGIGAGQDGSRLRIVEARYIDPKRKLVLVAKDNMEYLLLLCEGREMVIESSHHDAMMPAGDMADI
jgi:flagellar biogenesis protein FliO